MSTLYIELPVITGTGSGGGGGGGGGIQSINADTTAAQLIVSSSAGTDISISTAGGTTTIAIPPAASSATGIITHDTQTIGGAKTFNAPLTTQNGINDTGAVSITGNTDAVQLSVIGNSTQTNNIVNFHDQTVTYDLNFDALGNLWGGGGGLISSTASMECLLWGHHPVTTTNTAVNVGGLSCTVSGVNSAILGGNLNLTIGTQSGILGGDTCQTNGTNSVVLGGFGAQSHDFSEVVLGRFNIISSGNTAAFLTTNNAFIIGNGTASTARTNAFAIDFKGNLLAAGSGTFLGPLNASNLSGTNTGNQTITLTGDVTGSGTASFAATLATVNANVGSFGSSSAISVFTVNAKGLITAASTAIVSAAAGSLTGTVAIANGGTGQVTASSAFGALSPLTTKGDILGFSTVNARLPVGSNTQVLTADSTQALGIKWAAAAAGGTFSTSGVNGATVLATNTAYICDSTSGGFNLQLPAPANGTSIYIKDKLGTFNASSCVVVRNGSEKIEASASNYTLITNFGAWYLVSDGTDWYFF